MSQATRLLAPTLLVLAFAAPVSAQGAKPKGPRNKPPVVHVQERVIFRDSDRGVFSRYYETHRIVVTPLPPGIRKQIMRGKPLPPGIAKRELSPDLIVLAPRLDRGYSYALVGPSIVVLNPAGLVVDILVDVIR